MTSDDDERNLRIAEAIESEAQWEGTTFRQGQCVAILDGEIVAVADNPDDAINALRALDPDPRSGLVVPVEPPTVDVIRRARHPAVAT